MSISIYPALFQRILLTVQAQKQYLTLSLYLRDLIVCLLCHLTYQNENPGPGSYGRLRSIEPQSTSFSKKGFGGFVSKVHFKLECC